MKKLIQIAFSYAIAGMAGGVFFREFTKFNGFAGVTALGKVHTHLFMLGMVMFLIAALFSDRLPLSQTKQFKGFMVVYNAGVILTTVMMVVRGVFQVLGTELSKGADASVSGMAGIGHILTGTGIVLFFLAVKKLVK